MCNRHCRLYRRLCEVKLNTKILSDSIYESCHKVRCINHFVASSASFCSYREILTRVSMAGRAKIAANELAHQEPMRSNAVSSMSLSFYIVAGSFFVRSFTFLCVTFSNKLNY